MKYMSDIVRSSRFADYSVKPLELKNTKTANNLHMRGSVDTNFEQTAWFDTSILSRIVQSESDEITQHLTQVGKTKQKTETVHWATLKNLKVKEKHSNFSSASSKWWREDGATRSPQPRRQKSLPPTPY